MRVYMVVSKIASVAIREVFGLFDSEGLAEAFAAKKRLKKVSWDAISHEICVIPMDLIETGTPEANEIILS